MGTVGRARIGIDTGGTFTDFAWFEGGKLRIQKRLSTPSNPAQAVLEGIEPLALPPDMAVVHGSTVATNALLEKRGARTALVATAGFADALAIGRQNRPDLYALVPQRPEPLVPRTRRLEIRERVSARGDVLLPLTEDAIARLLDQLAEVEATSVAICLLFSFLRPEHELQIATAIREARAAATGRGEASPLPAYISLSSHILPEYREYERTATTVINAYVTPLMRDYLQTLASGLAPRTLAVMQSNGGIISAAAAGAQAARTVLSGPAGGVVGARYLAEAAGFEDVITFDMGGTSTDVALCPGRLPTTSLGEIAGLPLRLPIIDIHTVGAGGGSLARVDPGGALRVGPESAGADPGPVCYGRGGVGGDETANLYVTTTDANLVLGRLDAGHFLGGEMVLDEPQARRALAQLARQMGAATPEAAAWDVIRVANVTMERAIRRISLERGFDPRRFTLVAFGGAGPLHACDLARALQIPRVLVPLVPGVLSALGMLVAAPTKDYSQTVLAQGGGVGGGAGLERSLIALEARATADFAAEGYAGGEIGFRYSLDMRYVGQSHELTVGFTRDELVAPETPALPSRFHAHHQRRYGYQRPGAAVEIVTARLAATAATTPPPLEVQAPGTGAQPIGEKAIWFEGALQPTSLYRREQLAAGDRFSGPAVVFQYDTTTVVPPDWIATVDPFGNLIISA